VKRRVCLILCVLFGWHGMGIWADSGYAHAGTQAGPEGFALGFGIVALATWSHNGFTVVSGGLDALLTMCSASAHRTLEAPWGCTA
jgi:hypothetical protein